MAKVLTTHVGSLPRTQEVVDFIFARITRFFCGTESGLRKLVQAARFKTTMFEIVIVQPGFPKNNLSGDQEMVLGAASSFIKETVGGDLAVICSE